MDLDDIGDFIWMIIPIVFVGVILAFNFGVFDYFFGDDDSSDEFELTTTVTTIGIGQEKEIVPRMASSSILDNISWASSDTNILTISKDPYTTYGTVIIEGMSEGTATVTATYGDCSRTCTVTVQKDAPANELRVYNDNSESNRYAVLTGTGFESGVLSFSFNVGGLAIVTLSGYTQEMLDGAPERIGGRYDYKTVTMTATDINSGSVKVSSTYNNEYERSMLLNLGTLSVDTPYEIDFHVIPYYGDSYHITGTLEYKANDGSIDSTAIFKRPYAWRYDGNEYAFDLEFSYADYARYHTNALSGAHRSAWGDIWNRSSSENTSDFVRNNETLNEVNSVLKELYLSTYGSSASLKSTSYANFILAFVQINWYYAYDHHQYTGGSDGEYFSFPMETVYSGCGDCDDTTVLAASLFKGAGFKAGTFGLPGHAMAAVHIDNYEMPEYDQERYEYMAYYIGDPNMLYYGCETTTESFRSVGIANKSVLYDDNGNRYKNVELHRL